MTLTFIPTPGEFLVRNPLDFSALGAGPHTIFTVTGDVYIRLLAVVVSNIGVPAPANGEVGIAGATAAIIPSTVMTDLDLGEWWHDATPDAQIEPATIQKEFFISRASDIILTLDSATNAGTVMFYCYWTPLGDGSLVEFP